MRKKEECGIGFLCVNGCRNTTRTESEMGKLLQSNGCRTASENKNAIPEGIPYNPQIIAEVADGLRTSNSSQHSRDIAFGKDVADAFSNQIAMANTAQLDGIIDEVDNSPHLSPGQKSRLRKERNDQDRANDSVNSKEGQELISRVGNNFYLISTVRPIIDAKLAEIKKAIEKGEKEGLEPHLQIPVPTEEELKRLADDAQAVFFSDNILRNIVGGGQNQEEGGQIPCGVVSTLS